MLKKCDLSPFQQTFPNMITTQTDNYNSGKKLIWLEKNVRLSGGQNILLMYYLVETIQNFSVSNELIIGFPERCRYNKNDKFKIILGVTRIL